MAIDLTSARAIARKVVVPYSETYASAHKAFASRMWTKRRRREPVYQRWKFRGPETGPVPGLLLAVEKGDVVGQCGYIPVRVRAGAQEWQAQWGCDLMVDDRARACGYGALLAVAAMERGYLTLGSNPSPLAERLDVSLGFQRLRGPVIMLLPLDPAHVLSWRLKGILAPSVPFVAAALYPLVAVRNRRLWWRKQGGDYALCPWQDLQGEIVEHERSLAEPHVIHDAEFLGWRCRGPAGFPVEMSGVKSSMGGWALVGKANPYCYVHDWHASGPADCLCLARGIYAYARSIRASTVQMLANNAQEQQWLSKLGFLPMRTPIVVFAHPQVFPKGPLGHFRYSLYDSDENL